MRFYYIDFQDITKFKQGEEAESIQNIWKVVFEEMPLELKEFIRRLEIKKDILKIIKLELATHVEKSEDKEEFPFKFEIDIEKVISKKLKEFQEYFNNHVMVAKWNSYDERN